MSSRYGFVPVLAHRLEYVMLEPGASTRHGGPTLVLLHDGLGSVSHWGGFPRQLVEGTGCPALVYSRQGHGQSDPLTAKRRADYLHVEAQAALPEMLVQTRVTNPILVGHSDGASIALIHAASGFTVLGVVAMAPHVFVEPETLAGLRRARHTFEHGDLRRRLARHHRNPDATFHAWNDIWLATEFRDWNVDSLLPKIGCPLLLIQGEDDDYATLDQLATIARGARTRVETLALAGIGHAPWREAPADVISAVAAFIATL